MKKRALIQLRRVDDELYNRQSTTEMAPLKPSKLTGGCLTHPEGLADWGGGKKEGLSGY